jgi:hypothetical protein
MVVPGTGGVQPLFMRVSEFFGGFSGDEFYRLSTLYPIFPQGASVAQSDDRSLTMDTFQCISCGLHFPQMLDYYRHRVIEDGVARCMPAEQMFAESIKTAPKRLEADETRLFTKPKPRHRIAIPAPRSGREHLAGWFLDHGVRPERIAAAGVSQEAIMKAISERSPE